MYLTVTSLLLLYLRLTRATNFTDCGGGSVKSLTITPCEGDNLCNLVLGTQVTVEVDFVSPISTDTLEELIKGVVKGRELPFPEARKEPCSGYITPGCPVVAGSTYKFKATFNVKPFYPAIPIKMKYELVSPSGQMVMCYMIAAQIVDPNPKAKGARRGRGKKPATAKRVTE